MNRTTYTDVSTADLEDRRNSVDMLWLDTVEHKLQKELAELQDTIIDEESVGCCEMVDIAAKLQQELDECREQNKVLSKFFNDGIVWRNESMCKDMHEINELKSTIDEYRETVENRDKTIERRGDTIKKQHETINRANKVIKDFKTIETKETDRLHKIIDGLEYDLRICEGSGTAQDIYIAGLRKTIDEIMRGVRQQGSQVRVDFVVHTGVFLELP